MIKLSIPLICSGCHRRTRKMVAQNKKDGTWICAKCYKRGCVEHRPQGMSVRTAFYNLVKHGTFTPPKEVDGRPSVEIKKSKSVL